MPSSSRDQIKRIVQQADNDLIRFTENMASIHLIYEKQAKRNAENVASGLIDPNEFPVSDYKEQDLVIFQMAEFADLLRQQLEQYRLNMV